MSCQAQTTRQAPDGVNDKIGIYVTPDKAPKPFPVDYDQAIATLKGNARTVWVLDGWLDIETADGKYDWASMDHRIDVAIKNGFDVGIRTQLVICGNDNNNKPVAVSKVPRFFNQDMTSDEFMQKVARFYHELAARYKGKARYITIGNSVNSYFIKYPKQWEGFKTAYPAIVKAIREADPKVIILSDLEYGTEFFPDKKKMQPFLDFFTTTPDDGIGMIFYFIDSIYYGQWSNFNAKRFNEVLDEMHERTKGKKIYLIETACVSKDHTTGADIGNIQAMYLDWLIHAVVKKDYIMGVSWWQLYDARDEAEVPWDIKATFGLFDSTGKPKPAWAEWKKLCRMKNAN